MSNILIIGGSYFAGRVLVEELLRENKYRIFVFNRGRLRLNWKGVTELVGDRNDVNQIMEAIPKEAWHAVVDFCAYTPDDVGRLLTSLRGEVGHYIFISTTTVYEATTTMPVLEDAPKLTRSQPELGPYADYGFHKWLAECKVTEEAARRGIGYTCLRPCIIYGKYNYAPRESYFFDLVSRNETIIIPKRELALFSFVWVTDLAKVIVRCLGNPDVFNQAFNVSAPDHISYRRLVEVLEKISEKKLQVAKMSVEDIDAMKIPLPFPLDSHLLYSGTAIARKLGVEYTPFVDGMKKTYEYYKLLQQYKKGM